MTDDRPAASDKAVRARAIEADGSVLVQAPAGSGKTTLLVQRYLRLLASADAPAELVYPEGPNAQDFPRTVSRLVEMRTRDYMALPHATADSAPAAAAFA